MIKQRIGINFSTRNRPDTLEICLTQLYRFLSSERYQYVISVVNDLGDPLWDPAYDALREKFPDLLWVRMEQRMGIAKTKNVGVKLLKEKNCDHFFLFDDDAFPVKPGWEELYLSVAAGNGIHHLLHQFPLPHGFSPQRTDNGVCEYEQCCGVLLYFTRHAINVLGGYRKNFGIYGYEHAEISLRCHAAGLQPGWGAYCSPEKTREYIYSLDLDLNNWGTHPPDFVMPADKWRSSLLGEDVKVHVEYNAQFCNQPGPIFEEI